MRRFDGFIVNFEYISHLYSSVSIVNFEHVIAGWVSGTERIEETQFTLDFLQQRKRSE